MAADRIIIQSICDPIVSDKQTVVDEHSTVVDVPTGVTPQAFLCRMAGDLDGVIPDVGTRRCGPAYGMG